VTALLVIYAAGVALALWRTDASPLIRIALALLWPIGPLAFVVTVSMLLGAAVIAFPLFGAAVVIAAGAAWWVFR
jgi:hypothetical protein